MKVLVATSNRGKISEISQLLAGTGISILTPQEAGLKLEVEENGVSFEANAAIKAQAWRRYSGYPTLADDSGLCVDALAGRPGVHTARFAGEGATDQENFELLLKLMEGVTDRKAHFMCVMALAISDDMVITAFGRCEGMILYEPIGEGGFGYDPVFLDPETGKSFAQLTDNEKNTRSHRARALIALKQKLEEQGLIGHI
jgi:XTP/dITP diphosphohydrolase